MIGKIKRHWNLNPCCCSQHVGRSCWDHQVVWYTWCSTYLCIREWEKWGRKTSGKWEKEIWYNWCNHKERQLVVSRPKKIRILIVYPILSGVLRARKESVLIYLSCWSSCSLEQEHYKSLFQIQAVTLDDRTKGSDWK